MVRDTGSIRDPLGEIFLIIECTKRLDPEAFSRHICADGMPGPFVDPDEGRRLAAYQKACAAVREAVQENDRPLFPRH